ncbi:MAG TPA: hypothetical protein VKA21_13550, partial [Candidatus Binatia bacterium]|nr:hypothetical protein [Candidatus Binatia bacterium]
MREVFVSGELRTHQATAVVQVQCWVAGSNDPVPVTLAYAALETEGRARRGVREAGRRRLPRQLVEAGESRVDVVGVEPFGARAETVGAEGAQLDLRLLERTAARPICAGNGRTVEDDVRIETEDVVDADRDVDGQVEECPKPPVEFASSACGFESEPPVVDELDVIAVRRLTMGIRVERDDRSQRPRGLGGAGASGSRGKELRVALVQPHDGIGQPVRGEGLDPPAPSLRVDLDQGDFLLVVGADVEAAADEPAARGMAAGQHERVTERRDRLAPV